MVLLLSKVVPLLYRALVTRYMKALATTLGTLIIILLSTKLEDIARFISLGADARKIVVFVILQIPYLLQLALPLACVWSGYMTFSALNNDYLIAALRSSGVSIKNMLYPIGITTSLLAVTFFTLLFDLSAICHHKSKALEFDVRVSEPLALLVTSQTMQGSEFAFDLHGSLHKGDEATNMLLAFRPNENGISLILAEKMRYADDTIEADNVSLFSMVDEKERSSVLLENAKKVSTPSHHLYEVSGAKSWKMTEDHLSFRMLLARRQEMKQQITQKALEDKSANNAKKKLNRLTSEIGRRLSLSFACITLTLLAAGLAIHIRRGVRSFAPLQLIAWATFFSLFFLAAKTLDTKGWLSFALYLFPHPILFIAVRNRIERIEGGTL